MGLNGIPVAALVPARGGSKGVPRKNLAKVRGQLLISYTLNAALGCPQVDETYVSSDDADILAASRELGVHAFERPAAAASDDASAVLVVEHFLKVLPPSQLAQNPYVVYLQPTSPLRSSLHIERALEQMVAAGATTAISVVELAKSPFKSFSIDETGHLKSLFDERLSNARRQDLPRTYLPNGAIYVFRVSDFVERGGFPSNGSVPYVMSEEDSLDIDSAADLARLEVILEKRSGHQNA